MLGGWRGETTNPSPPLDIGPGASSSVGICKLRLYMRISSPGGENIQSYAWFIGMKGDTWKSFHQQYRSHGAPNLPVPTLPTGALDRADCPDMVDDDAPTRTQAPSQPGLVAPSESHLRANTDGFLAVNT